MREYRQTGNVNAPRNHGVYGRARTISKAELWRKSRYAYSGRGGKSRGVTRPLRHLDGKPVVKYKKQLRPLINGGEVYLDEIAPADDAQAAEATGMDKSDSAPNSRSSPPPSLSGTSRNGR